MTIRSEIAGSAVKSAAAGICFALLCSHPGTAQEPSRGRASQTRPEIALPDQPPTFRARADLVLVPVVVRDSAGRAVGHLQREDFKLFDGGRPQEITTFSLAGWERSSVAAEGGTGSKPVLAVPERFVAYLFDDIHIGLEELPRLRSAALRHLATLRAGDRAAILTTSGRLALEFTADRERLRQAIERLRSKSDAGTTECFHLGYYWADLVDKGDPQAMAAAKRLAAECYGSTQQEIKMENPQAAAAANRLAAENSGPMPDGIIKSIARQQVLEGELETRISLTMLRNLVRRMASAPGQRTIVLASPGFYAPPEQFDQSGVFDAAARANVVVNCLNSLGLVTPQLGRKGQIGRNFSRERDMAWDAALATIAGATGGSYFHNNNDLEAGLRQLAAAPEFYYVLGFSPQDLKLDGKFHSLKVALVKSKGFSVTARHGYYASSRMANTEEAAKIEINDALYSHGNMGGLRFELRSTVSKSPEGKNTLEVSAWMDPKELRMHKQGDTSRKALTLAFGLFDRDGRILATTRKDVGLQIRDRDLEKMSGRWVVVKASFPVKPGGYAVRVVVRDGDEQLVSSESGAVEVGKEN
ncbi:MAG: VWA domain-containing protein [Bryobacteraceae bacterium]